MTVSSSLNLKQAEIIVQLSKVNTMPLIANQSLCVQVGKSWTTDAPYRETESAIAHAQTLGAGCVEMEASALYAFSKLKLKPVVCFAHLTNSMAKQNGDFEKGAENGSLTSLELVYQTVKLLNQL
jgi:purine-nucleoside phosphorylase